MGTDVRSAIVMDAWTDFPLLRDAMLVVIPLVRPCVRSSVQKRSEAAFPCWSVPAAQTTVSFLSKSGTSRLRTSSRSRSRRFASTRTSLHRQPLPSPKPIPMRRPSTRSFTVAQKLRRSFRKTLLSSRRQGQRPSPTRRCATARTSLSTRCRVFFLIGRATRTTRDCSFDASSTG